MAGMDLGPYFSVFTESWGERVMFTYTYTYEGGMGGIYNYTLHNKIHWFLPRDLDVDKCLELQMISLCIANTLSF